MFQIKSATNLIITHSHYCRVSQIHRQVTEYNNVSCYGDHLQCFITCHMHNIYRHLCHNLKILQGHVKWQGKGYSVYKYMLGHLTTNVHVLGVTRHLWAWFLPFYGARWKRIVIRTCSPKIKFRDLLFNSKLYCRTTGEEVDEEISSFPRLNQADLISY